MFETYIVAVKGTTCLSGFGLITKCQMKRLAHPCMISPQ